MENDKKITCSVCGDQLAYYDENSNTMRVMKACGEPIIQSAETGAWFCSDECIDNQ